MSESFQWIEGGALGRLAASLHVPEGEGPFPGVLFCHGFTGNRVEPQRLFLEFARRLTRQGLAVLRFDFGGHGESEGAFQDLTLTGELQDVKAAWEHLGACPKVDASRRALLGFSLGGYMAARSAPRLEASGAKALVLWSAVDDPRRRLGLHFFGLHGEDKMRSGESVDVGGLSLGPGFVKDMDSHDRIHPGEGFRGAVLSLHGERDQTVPLESQETYRAILGDGKGSFEASVVPLAGHLYDRVSARETLYRETERFLSRHLETGLALRDGVTERTR